MSNKYPGGIITSGANAGYSVAFDGTGDYLTVASSANLILGTGAFTVEAWFYVAVGNTEGVLSCIDNGSGSFGIGMYFSTTTSLRVSIQSNSVGVLNYDSTIAVGNWYHVVAVRDGSNNFAVFLNGTRTGSTTNTTNISLGAWGIGRTYANSGSSYNGYISNVRIVKGTAVYDPTQTSIRVPTQLFNITNTSLLTCNSPAIVDQSTNAFAITANGNAAVSTFTPFTGYQAYNPALGASTPGIWSVSDAIQARQTRRWNMYDPYFQNTTLLLHGNGTNGAQNNTFLDSSSNNFSITRNGNTTQGTFSPFSQAPGYWSNYFDGSSAKLTLPSNAVFSFGTGAYTVEFWIYFFSIAGTDSRVFDAGSASGSFGVSIDNTNAVNIAKYGTGYVVQSPAKALPSNQWAHVAVVRDSTSTNATRIYINGSLVVTGTDNNNWTVTTTPSICGLDLSTYNPQCYLSNLRVVKGGALYTSNFTPTTAPLSTTVSSGTVSLLTCQSSRFVDNSVNAFTITTVSTPSVQAFSPFYPVVAYTPSTIGGSEYQASGSNALTTAYNAAFSFGSGDFTIQFWAYPTAAFTANDHALVSIGENVGTNKNLLFSGYTGSSGTAIRLALSSNGSTFDLVASQDCGTITLNAWNHYGIVRSGTTVTVYKNGTSVGSFAVSTSSLSSQTAYGVTIANYRNSGALTSNSFPGYIAGLQILKGTAINFASTGVPTAPPTAITNTSLLCNFTNGAIADSTGKNVLETVGNAQISTTQSKFGGSSMYFDGTGDYIAMPATKPLLFGTAPFTVEGWIYLTSTGIEQFIYSFSYTSSNFQFYVTTANKLRYTRGATILITGTSTLSANTWYHVALVRTGTGTNGLTIYLNGTSEGSATEATDFGGTGTVNVGQFVGGGDYELNGYIDDFRVTTGYARYTANFTPQTSQWQDQ